MPEILTGGRFRSRALGGGQDQADRAVVDQAVIQQAQRRGDVPRIFVVVDRDGGLHHGVGVQAGVVAKGHRHFRQVAPRGAILLRMALEHQRMAGARRGEAPRIPDVGAFVATIVDTPGASDIGIDQRDVIGQPRIERCHRLDDGNAGHAAMRGQGQGPARIQPQHLAHAGVRRYAADAQAVDQILVQAAIIDGVLERPCAQAVFVQLGKTAIRRGAHADHRIAVLQGVQRIGFAVAHVTLRRTRVRGAIRSHPAPGPPPPRRSGRTCASGRRGCARPPAAHAAAAGFRSW